MARRDNISSVGVNAVDVMARGPKRCSWQYAPRVWPVTASTIRPTQSMPMPYSQRVPGSNINGTRNACFLSVAKRGQLVCAR